MKHLLINEAYFIISSVNDKKNFSTAVAFKKVKLHTKSLAQWTDGPDGSEWHNNCALYSTSYEDP